MTNVGFLLDVNVGTTVARFLRTGGFDVLPVSEIDPRMSDEAILALAVEQYRVLITIDGLIRLEDTRPGQHIQ